MIAYYAHQHGSGHSNYAQIFAKHSGYNMPVFTSSHFQFDSRVEVITMPAEDPDGTEVGTDIIPNPDYLHYSPVGQKSIQERSALFLNEIVRRSIKLVIVDLSVEIAALCRSSSIPYAYVRLPGNRNDPGHIQAFQGATFLLAYYPPELDGPEIPKWIRDKTIYTGFFSKFEQIGESPLESAPIVSVFTGNGGNSNLMHSLPHLADRFKEYDVEVYGTLNKEIQVDNLVYKGRHPDPAKVMKKSGIIVANCGLNLTSEILSVGKSFISIPEERPYEEQFGMHRFLTATGLAIDVSNEWSYEKLSNYVPQNLDQYINQKAPLEFLDWVHSHGYNPGSMRKSIYEFDFKNKQLKTA